VGEGGRKKQNAMQSAIRELESKRVKSEGDNRFEQSRFKEGRRFLNERPSYERDEDSRKRPSSREPGKLLQITQKRKSQGATNSLGEDRRIKRTHSFRLFGETIAGGREETGSRGRALSRTAIQACRNRSGN